MFRIALVCLGNICRSPMAHVVLEKRLTDAGLDHMVEVVSAGTGDWHVGQGMDKRAAAALSEASYDASRHVARNFTIDWYAENDLLLAMDESNYTNMADLSPSVDALDKLHMFREFDPQSTDADIEVPDPWYGGTDGFAHVLEMVERTVDGLIDALPSLLCQHTD